MKNLMLLSVVALSLNLSGCDEGMTPSSNPPASNVQIEKPKSDKVDVNVNLHPNNAPVDDRAELRQERRENIRDAINGVDVNVEGGKTKVDVK